MNHIRRRLAALCTLLCAFSACTLGLAGDPPTLGVAVSSTSSVAVPVSVASDSQLVAQTPVAGASALRSALERALDEFNPETLPDVEAAKQQLALALADLEAFVDLPSANGQAWSQFLQLDELHEQLEQPRASASRLASIEAGMRQNYAGLELPQFLALRQAVSNYTNATKYGVNSERTIQVLQRRTQELLEQLDGSADTSASEVNRLAARLAAYFHESGQAPAAMNAIVSQYGNPNLQIDASEAFINSLLGQSVAQPRNVNECILGTRINGTACLTGNVSANLSPMHNGVALTIHLSGHVATKNRGYNRGVVIHATGNSTVYASKHVVATPTGVTSTAATVSSDLRTQINSIQHRMKIVRKIASRKAAEQKPQADAIARVRLNRRVASSFDEQVNTKLAEANSNLQKLDQPMPVLTRLGLSRPTFSFASTSSSVGGTITHAATHQLAASNSPLPSPSQLHGLAVDLHQSILENVIESFLQGRTLRSADLDDYAQQFVGEVPPELAEESQNEQWSILFETYRPVGIEFDNGRIQLTLRMVRLSGPQGDLSGNPTATVTYVPIWGDGKIVLQREGEVETDFGAGGGGLQNTNKRSVLRKKLDDVFKPEIEIPLDGVSKAFPKLAGINIDTLSIEDGWLQVTFR